VRSPTRRLTPAAIAVRLAQEFSRHLGVGRHTASSLVRSARMQDKAYELSAMLSLIGSIKHVQPRLVFRLNGGTNIAFKTGGGPIVRGATSHIEIFDGALIVGEIWTDVECLAISAGPGAKSLRGNLYGKCHELDVVVVRPGTRDRPLPKEILIGAEAKNRPFNKQLLKQLLGVRREMMMRAPRGTRCSPWFVWWDRMLPANPASGLVAYCSSPLIDRYKDPADYWGIRMEHVPF